MRLKQLVNLLSLSHFRRLRAVFKSPYKAFLATSGIFKQPVELATKDGASMLVSRADRHLWHWFFHPQKCEVWIEQGMFKVIPDEKKIPAYFIAPEHSGVTHDPQRWYKPALEIPLVKTLQEAEHSVYSQHGEDGVLAVLLDMIPTKHRYLVEFGAHDGINMSNSRNLVHEQNWCAFLIEAMPASMPVWRHSIPIPPE